MIPRSTRETIKQLADYHAHLCKIIKMPDYQVNREIELTSVGVLIGARIKVDARAKRFVTLVAHKYAPINRSNIIIPK